MKRSHCYLQTVFCCILVISQAHLTRPAFANPPQTGPLPIPEPAVPLATLALPSDSDNQLNKAPSDIENFQFRRDYLRLSVVGLYFSKSDHKSHVISVMATTMNKDPLTFSLNPPFQTAQNKTYSDPGQYQVIPYVALNIRSPLAIEVDDNTQYVKPQSLNFGMTLLSTIGSFFTGGAAGTVSLLSKIANSSMAEANTYLQGTARTDVNQTMLFDKGTINNIDPFNPANPAYSDTKLDNRGLHFQTMRSSIEALPDTYHGMILAVLNGGQPQFNVTDAKGNCYRMSEQDVAAVIPEDAAYLIDPDANQTAISASSDSGSADSDANPVIAPHPTPWAFVSLLPLKSKKGMVDNYQPSIYYPDGNFTFVVLKVERYKPYIDLEDAPEQVVPVKDSFAEVNTILIEQRDNATTADAMYLKEGKKLHDNLETLVDNGDVSDADANTVMTAFANRVQDAQRSLFNQSAQPSPATGSTTNAPATTPLGNAVPPGGALTGGQPVRLALPSLANASHDAEAMMALPMEGAAAQNVEMAGLLPATNGAQHHSTAPGANPTTQQTPPGTNPTTSSDENKRTYQSLLTLATDFTKISDSAAAGG